MPAPAGVSLKQRTAAAEGWYVVAQELIGDGKTHREIAGAVDRSLMTVRSRMAPEELSLRQIQILWLTGQGLSNAEIAQLLRVSLQAVKSQLQNCYRRLGVLPGSDKRYEAFLFAEAAGYFENFDPTDIRPFAQHEYSYTYYMKRAEKVCGLREYAFEVLWLIYRGKTIREIAQSSNRPEGTAKAYLALALRALQVDSRIDATKKGIKLGILPEMIPNPEQVNRLAISARGKAVLEVIAQGQSLRDEAEKIGASRDMYYRIAHGLWRRLGLGESLVIDKYRLWHAAVLAGWLAPVLRYDGVEEGKDEDCH